MNMLDKLAVMGITYIGDSPPPDAELEASALYDALHAAYYNRFIDDEGALWQHARDLAYDGSWDVEALGGLALNFERLQHQNHHSLKGN